MKGVRQREGGRLYDEKGRLGRFCSVVPDALVPLQTMPVACLSACQPAILSASLAETERQREEQRRAVLMPGRHGGNQRGTGARS